MRSRAVWLLALAACTSPDHCEGFVPTAELRVAGERFTLEIADELDEQQLGLMGRSELPADGGMVFRWDDVAERSFYMKDTLIPLDLIAIEDDKVVSVASMVPCEQTPCITTKTAPASEVVEINGGLAEELGIEVGDRATIGDIGCG
jgi:uncharacterized membrane protein (UPF0127 family)